MSSSDRRDVPHTQRKHGENGSQHDALQEAFSTNDSASSSISAHAPDAGVSESYRRDVTSEGKRTGNVTYGGNNYQLEALQERMDADLVVGLDHSLGNQEFFASYLLAHSQKHGERFVMD